MPRDITQLNDEDLEKVEGNIVNAILGAAAYRDKQNNRRLINIKRKGKLLFQFTIEPIDEDTWQKCRRKNTFNRGKRTEEVNNSRFLAEAIFEATIDADKVRVWNNQEVWRQLGVASGIDVVNIVLTPAEKAKVIEILEDIGGYNDDDLEGMVRDLSGAAIE